MSTHRVKEVKSVRPSLKRYPSSASLMNEKKTDAKSAKLDPLGVVLLLTVIVSLMVLPHLALASVQADSLKPAGKITSQSKTADFISVKAKAGSSAWSLIQNANPKEVDMQDALDQFKALNGTVDVKLGYTYKVPLIKH